jgi:hypothetical protein
MAKSLEKMTTEELEAAQAECVRKMRVLEDEAETYGAELEARAAAEQFARVRERLMRELRSLPSNVRDAAIAGVSAGVTADAPEGGV